MTSSSAGHAFQVGILPLPSGASAGFPVTRFGTNQSASRYQSGRVLMIGPGLEALFSFNQGLFATNRIFFVSTSGVTLYFIGMASERMGRSTQDFEVGSLIASTR